MVSRRKSPKQPSEAVLRLRANMACQDAQLSQWMDLQEFRRQSYDDAFEQTLGTIDDEVAAHDARRIYMSDRRDHAKNP